MSDELPELLDEMRQSGRLDSSGRFALGPEMIQKLRQFQLADPWFYAVPIVSGALSRGATYVEVRNDLDACTIEFDGQPFELGSLLGHIFSEKDPALADIATGVNAAIALGKVTVESGHQRILYGPDLVLTDRPEGCPTHIQLQEIVGLGHLVELLGNVLQGGPAESRALKRYCRFAPARTPIRVNGKVINPPVDLGETLMWVHIQGPEPLDVAPSQAPFQRVSTSAQLSAVLGLTGNYQLELTLTRRGIAYDAGFDPRTESFGLVGVAASPDLNVELSRSRLVDNDALRSLRAALEEQFEIMIGELAAGWERLEKPDWAVLLYLDEHHRWHGRLRPLFPVLEKLVQLDGLKETYGGECHIWLAAALLKAGQPTRALEVLRKVWKVRGWRQTSVTRTEVERHLAIVHLALGEPGKALKYAKRGPPAAETFSQGRMLCHLAEVHQARGEQESARKLIRRFRVERSTTRDTVRFHLAVGSLEPAEASARVWIEQAAKMCAQAYAPSRKQRAYAQVEWAQSQLHLAVIRSYQGAADEAEGLTSQAYEVLSATFGPVHPETAGARALLGRLRGDGALLEQSRKDFIEIFGSEHPDVAELDSRFTVSHGEWITARYTPRGAETPLRYIADPTHRPAQRP